MSCMGRHRSRVDSTTHVNRVARRVHVADECDDTVCMCTCTKGAHDYFVSCSTGSSTLAGGNDACARSNVKKKQL